MASVFKYGKMEPSTRANGRIIKLTGRVPSGTQMVTTMRASFATINQMAMVYSTVLMEQWTNARMRTSNELFHARTQEQHYRIAVSSKSHSMKMRMKGF